MSISSHLPGMTGGDRYDKTVDLVSLLTRYEDAIDIHASLMPEVKHQLEDAIGEVRDSLSYRDRSLISQPSHNIRRRKRERKRVEELHNRLVEELQDGLVEISKPSPELSAVQATIARFKDISEELRSAGGSKALPK